MDREIQDLKQLALQKRRILFSFLLAYLVVWQRLLDTHWKDKLKRVYDGF